MEWGRGPESDVILAESSFWSCLPVLVSSPGTLYLPQEYWLLSFLLSQEWVDLSLSSTSRKCLLHVRDRPVVRTSFGEQGMIWSVKLLGVHRECAKDLVAKSVDTMNCWYVVCDELRWFQAWVGLSSETRSNCFPPRTHRWWPSAVIFEETPWTP